ncbi:MAG TPA: hypothetical protein VFV68_03800, partial [Agriterribacter sp.]|nr:hypothetical protein [Agriterribacter sp.]
YKHADIYGMYFCTFTCYKWLHLFEITSSYDLVYNWFSLLKNKSKGQIIAYVIMPNHLHFIVYFETPCFNLNSIISNAKRFMAYEIVRRLKQKNEEIILDKLNESVSERERNKGQLHKVFKDSFDAKAIFSDTFLHQKIAYIHHNPVHRKWKLVNAYTDYEHSSASYYELNIIKHFMPLHYNAI